MATKMKPIEVINDNETAPELLASSILEVSAAAKKLLSGRLTERAILLLIKDSCAGVGMGEIKAVLQAASRLDRYVVKKPIDKSAP